MEILKEISERFSIRRYLNRDIDRSVIDRILEAGCIAPSAKNRQPWRFIVIQNQENKDQIMDAAYGEEFISQAGAIIAVCTTNVDYKMPNGQLSYPIDLTFAASYMVLQAQHEGLGSCIVTTYQEPVIREILTVPYSMKVVMLITIGYPDEDISVRNRTPVGSISSFEHW
ncbi:nitroreductase family protein [Spirochaeta cellobiosiphila]|uniref:nitroreductase family protein n=1 Tax=Spirochaeta cellobiosiphila TaxID=504483 RepID=UPI0003F6DD57|nr:nitroreductase family protein [Spirochaeta cellobiosiphila]